MSRVSFWMLDGLEGLEQRMQEGRSLVHALLGIMPTRQAQKMSSLSPEEQRAWSLLCLAARMRPAGGSGWDLTVIQAMQLASTN